MHPVRDRYTRPKFEIDLQTGIASGGALVVQDRALGAIVGSLRFTAFDPSKRTVEIGYTFLARNHWGTGANRELKTLMLAQAFQHVDAVEFVVGVKNLRSRGAMEKLGGKLARTIVEREPEGDLRESVVYVIEKNDWESRVVGTYTECGGASSLLYFRPWRRRIGLRWFGCGSSVILLIRVIQRHAGKRSHLRRNCRASRRSDSSTTNPKTSHSRRAAYRRESRTYLPPNARNRARLSCFSIRTEGVAANCLAALPVEFHLPPELASRVGWPCAPLRLKAWKVD